MDTHPKRAEREGERVRPRERAIGFSSRVLSFSPPSSPSSSPHHIRRRLRHRLCRHLRIVSVVVSTIFSIVVFASLLSPQSSHHLIVLQFGVLASLHLQVYFSDSQVTLPPPCWTNTAHRHVVKVLGTFIKEWDEDKATCNEMLAAKESAQMYAERLVELSTCLGFDGWMINIENEIDEEQIPNLKEFVSHIIKV
ncbi:hypothetical protein Bca4012_063357 [Brassica carinata]